MLHARGQYPQYGPRLCRHGIESSPLRAVDMQTGKIVRVLMLQLDTHGSISTPNWLWKPLLPSSLDAQTSCRSKLAGPPSVKLYFPRPQISRLPGYSCLSARHSVFPPTSKEFVDDASHSSCLPAAKYKAQLFCQNQRSMPYTALQIALESRARH